MDTDPLEEQGGLGDDNDDGWGSAEHFAETPRPGGWQRVAAKMGDVSTPELQGRVAFRRRQRRLAGLDSLARQSAPEKIVIEGIDPLIDKMDEVIDMLLETRPRRNVQAPPRPKPDLPPPTSPRPQPSIRSGKGGVQLP